MRIVRIKLDHITDGALTCGTAIDLPSQFMAVLRESERDLGDILDSKPSPSEDSVDEISLLQLAMGWPTGVRLLLQAQSGMHLPHLYHRRYPASITDEDNEIDQYIDSCNLLLKAGYTISHYDIVDNSSKILKISLITELAKRRRKLLDIAEAHIHPSELSYLRKGETGIPDAYASTLCDALISKGHKIDPALMTFERKSLFFNHQSTEILNRIFEAGFTDVDLLSEEGHTPLMALCRDCFGHSSYAAIAWMISKGANPFRKLPGSNTTVLHWINGMLATKIQHQYRRDSHFALYAELRHLHQIDKHLLSLSTKDECFCSCSLNGCTPLSIALRDVVSLLSQFARRISLVAPLFRRFLEFILDRSQSQPELCHAMIRSLTFDGLGLSHTCCIELQLDPLWGHARHESDLQEIRDEQELPLERFEKLVSEFDFQFDALGLPLMDFLQEIWYERMVKFLSERDKYDPEHHEKIKELGINSWEMDEIQIPLVVQLICDQVRVVESDSEDS